MMSKERRMTGKEQAKGCDRHWASLIGDRILCVVCLMLIGGFGSAAAAASYLGPVAVVASKDGKEVWRVPGIIESWSTPLVVKLPDGQEELVLSMKGKVLGIDPATGKKLWECEGIGDYVVPMVVADDKGVVYISGGQQHLGLENLSAKHPQIVLGLE